MTSLGSVFDTMGSGLSGVFIGALLGIATTVCHQRYTKFKDSVSDLSFRVMTLNEHIQSLEARNSVPLKLWIEASDVTRNLFQPAYFTFALSGHTKAKAELAAFINEILNDLNSISSKIHNLREDDPLLQFTDQSKSQITLSQWGAHIHRNKDKWTFRMLKLEPNWEAILCVPKKPKSEEENETI